MKFLITSYGRTGTAWLAWVMDHSPTWVVGHEKIPKSDLNIGVVAPSYLERFFDIDVPKKGIVIRHPVECMVSSFNHAKVRGYSCGDTETIILDRWPRYIEILDKALKDGARLLTYSMFNDIEYVQNICEQFGILDFTVGHQHLSHRVNSSPIVYRGLDDLPQQIREYVMGEPMVFWNKWGDLS